MTQNAPIGEVDSPVPLARIAAFIRQVTHDVRNSLNSMDLQAAFVLDLVSDPEVGAEVKRIRALIQTAARQMQALSTNFHNSPLSLVTYSAAILMEDLHARILKNFPEEGSEIGWEAQLDEQSIDLDVEAFFAAVNEMVKNALQFRVAGSPISIRAGREGGRFFLEIVESKPAPETSPDRWGAEPLVSTRRGGYGLGLFRARRIIQAHGGDLTIFYDSARAALVSRVWLPFATPA